MVSDVASPQTSDTTLERCAFELQGVYPELDTGALTVAADTPTELALDGDGLHARFPRSEVTAEQLALQAALLPHLRGFLSPAVPLFERRGEPSREWPHGWYAAPQVAGKPMRAAALNDDNIERLVRGLAQFLFELHQFPLPRARCCASPNTPASAAGGARCSTMRCRGRSSRRWSTAACARSTCCSMPTCAT